MKTCCCHAISTSNLSFHCKNLDIEIYGFRKQTFITARHSPISRSQRRPIQIQCAVRFRPCIDIHKGKVKQIVGSTLTDLKAGESALVTNFESDKSAAEFANMYKADELSGGHVIMLGADPLSVSAAIEALHAYPGTSIVALGNLFGIVGSLDVKQRNLLTGRSNYLLWFHDVRVIADTWIIKKLRYQSGLQVGGGINSHNALNYIEEGASHVIVTSYVFSKGQMDLERLKDLVRVVGKQRLVLDLSCRKKDGKYAIVTDRWQKFTDVFLDEAILDFLASYADEFLVHGVDVEGKRLGIDEELVALLGRHSSISVTYAGGVTAIADLERIKLAGIGRVDATVGSALDIFGGNLIYKDVVAWHAKQQEEVLMV